MLKEHLVSLNYSVFLVLQVKDSIRELYGKIVFNLIAKGVDQNLDINLIRSWLIAEVCFLLVEFDVIKGQRNCFFPECFKLFFAVINVIKILHGDVEFIARRLGDA